MLDLARRLVAATASGDLEAMRQIYDPELVVWHNFDSREIGLEASLRSAAWLHQRVSTLRFDDVQLLPTNDGFVVRFVMSGDAPGGAVRAASCQVVTVANGRVLRIDEYIDSAQIQPLYG